MLVINLKNVFKKHNTDNKKKGGILGIVTKVMALVVIFGIVGSGMSIWQEYRTPPEEVVIRAIAETIQAPSYSYYSLSKRIIGDKEEVLSEVWGEKNQESTHLSGKIHVVNSEFEIYQVDNRFYRQDVVSKDWLIVDDMGEAATIKLIQEIDPLANFVFGEQIEVQYMGKEKIEKSKCKKYQIIAYGTNDYLTSSWEEFFYTVWVDKQGYIRQAEVTAVDSGSENEQLRLLVQFTVVDEVLHIEAPL